MQGCLKEITNTKEKILCLPHSIFKFICKLENFQLCRYFSLFRDIMAILVKIISIRITFRFI